MHTNEDFIKPIKREKSSMAKKIEPWHWRYVGNKLATELFEKKMSFAERFYIKNLDTPHI